MTMKKLDYEQIMYLYTNQEILNYSNRKRMAMKKIVNSIYDIYSEKLPKSFDGVRIVMLSDLHDNVYGISLEKLYRMIEEQQPEFVIVAGDLLTRKHSDGSDEVVALLKRLADKYPVFFANGNHETKVKIYTEKYGDRYDRLMDALKNAGVKILNNKNIYYRKNGEIIHIYGLEIDKDFFLIRNRPKMEDDYISSIIGEKIDGFGILIAHNPMYFEQYAAWGADLVFSGHVHGGIIRLPFVGGVLNPDYSFFPHYDGGMFDKEKSVMLLGRGLGTHTINVRINNPPELVTAVLHTKERNG